MKKLGAVRPLSNKFSPVDILVVDDRLDGLVAIEAVLSNPRYNVVTAQSGFEALKLLSQYDFAVILLDVQMPGIDGFETAAEIKKIERFRHIPILFVTAINKDDRYAYKGYESGAVDYVFKPFDPYILQSKVGVFVDLFLQARKIREQEMLLMEAERAERVRQLAELELESLRRFQHLANAVPHIIVRTLPDSTPVYFNERWSAYTGLSSDASVGMAWQRFMHQEDLTDLLKVWLDALISGQSFEAEARIKDKDGNFRWHLIRAVPERRTSDEIIGWTGTAVDIEDRKHAESELLRAKDDAEAASLAKTQFLANMSHEIRTPLSAILGFSELLINNEGDEEEKRQSLLTLRRNGQQLLTLINEILDISKVEAGKIEVESLKLDMNFFFNELLAVFNLKAAEKGLELQMVLETAVPAYLMTDETRLRQILLNVIGNALKFTEKGSVKVGISFVRNAEGGELKVIVRDTGIGIPQERVDRLFQPFSQVDSSTTRRFGGSGLGLALSKKLAETLGGEVKLTSSDDNGSEFEISIQTQAEGLEELASGSLSNRKFEEVRVQPSIENRLKDVRILVVDDAPDNRVLISRFLQMAGASVDVACNGDEGVERTMSENYDLVLMDIQMPGTDGYTATKTLRSNGVTLPILALTAHAMSTERARCLAAGFDDHLSKPVDKMKLVMSCAEWLVERAEVMTKKPGANARPLAEASLH